MARSNNGTVTIRRTPDEPGDACGATEAAEILEVERTRIPRYARQGKMPTPLFTLANDRRVWLRSDIEEMKDRRDAQKARREAEREAADQRRQETAKAA